MIKYFLNPKGHQNPISASKVTAILLKGRILPIGGASSGEACIFVVLFFLRGGTLINEATPSSL